MGGRELVFDILAIDRASAVFGRVAGEAGAMGNKVTSASKVMSHALNFATVAAVAVGVESVKTAADMETSMTRLTTTAGESVASLGMVHAGIDKLAGRVGYTVTQLADAMYYVESGGYHGAKGLEVLAAAAKAAKIENASATDVAHALTGVLNDYRGTGLSTAVATNTLTAAVGHGMMTFQDFAEALPKVGARAAAAHVTFQELTAAMATMTQDGLPATVAATYLGQTIGQLAAPTAKAAKEMKGLGINSTELSATITSGSGHGLGDAIQMLYNGINNHLSPAGLVAVETFKKSKGSATDFQKVLANLPPSMQTTVQALAVMAGGVKGFQGVLMLGGKHQEQYNANLAAMNKQVKSGGKDIAGYAEQQKTLNGRLADAKGAMSAVFDQLGTRMLPVLADWAGKLVPLTDFLMKHADTLGKVAIAIGLLKVATVAYTVVQWALNIAMDANPIGLVVVAIEALAVGFYLLYTRSETFRRILQVVFDNLKVGFLAMSLVGVKALHYVSDTFLHFVSTLIHGAEAAWGWVPGLGPKLHDAAAAVDGFRASANNSLSRIENNLAIKLNTAIAEREYNNLVAAMSKPVSIPVFLKTNYTAGTVNVAGVGKVNAGMRAAGGPVEAGMTYRVGENGPEDVTFGSSGYVHDAKTTKARSGHGNGPVVNIENYHEGSKPVHQIAAELMFRARFA